MTTRPPASSQTGTDESVSEPEAAVGTVSEKDVSDTEAGAPETEEAADSAPDDTQASDSSPSDKPGDTPDEAAPDEDTRSVVVTSGSESKTKMQAQFDGAVSALKSGLAATGRAVLTLAGHARGSIVRSLRTVKNRLPDRLTGHGASDGDAPQRVEITQAERVPLVRSVQLRLLILLLVAVWILVFPPRGFLEQIYTLSIVLMLVCIGVVQWLCTWPKIYRPSIFAALLCLDCVFMALVAGLQNPFSETPQPLAAALRDRGFLFLTLPILQSVLTANPLFPAISGVCAALCWTGLVGYVLSDDVSYSRLDLDGLPAQQLDAAYFDPNFVVIDNAALEVVFLALLGVGLAFFMWRRARSAIGTTAVE